MLVADPRRRVAQLIVSPDHGRITPCPHPRCGAKGCTAAETRPALFNSRLENTNSVRNRREEL